MAQPKLSSASHAFATFDDGKAYRVTVEGGAVVLIHPQTGRRVSAPARARAVREYLAAAAPTESRQVRRARERRAGKPAPGPVGSLRGSVSAGDFHAGSTSEGACNV